MDRARASEVLPLAPVGGVVVLVTAGFAQGWFPGNLHNGLLALSCTIVGAYVLFQRPGHREGWLLVAAGVVEAWIFLGRQLAQLGGPDTSRWWGWIGVWPVPLALATVTIAVVCFPDGRLPSPRWRPVIVGIAMATAVSCTLSALWSVGYPAAGVDAPHPFSHEIPPAVDRFWQRVVLPSFVTLQLLWVVAVIDRSRRPGNARALVWLLGAVATSAAALVVGLAAAGSPRAGLLTAALVPVAAGIAVVHGQHVTAYSALRWLSDDRDGLDLPDALARATATALSARGAALWMGPPERLVSVGAWPEPGRPVLTSTSAAITADMGHVRQVRHGSAEVGLLAVDRDGPLARSESGLLDDLARQASLVLDHLGLTRLVTSRRDDRLAGLTPRERDVLALIASGCTNAAICEELSLSVKTVEPLVGSVFAKLGLRADAATNRRVLAAVEYLDAGRADG